ncbi:hypothetical protein VSX64_20935 [Aurantimonas sp. C2-6-R+9]|nr:MULTISPECIES: hypothetical protein [unclassified Aurantimonas]MEC5293702.1 hypothetical protein [Aurantimonas sp. C2-3-R2]MEC5383280.1 hypothetical protein [Aurantimonas sp. C2-6-R+9]MEC5414246.1 hypothetical protein [Aurantimonas sp. C2-4-R8]
MFEIADEDEAADAANLMVWLAVGLIVGGTLGFIAGVAATNLLWVLA